MGTQTGGNLLQSFTTFNLAKGDTATFTGPSSVSNIISRVTGGAPSTINGTIASDIPGANLWFFNPKGILFGNGASLNITGSFHASTADSIILRDGTSIPAKIIPGVPTILTNASPYAFGFIDAATVNNSSLTLQNANLSVPEGQSIGLVGSHVDLTASVLSAPSGQISVVSINDTGEVQYSDQGYSAKLDHSSGFSGDITLTNTALKVDGKQQGNLQIEGGNIKVNTNETDVIPSIANLSTPFVEEMDLLAKPCELAKYYGSGSLTFTVDEMNGKSEFGVETKKIKDGALGLEKQGDCL